MHASQHTSQGNWHSGLVIDLCVHNLWSGLVTRNQPRDILDRRSTCIVIHVISYVADGGTGTGLPEERQHAQGESL